MKRGDEVRMLLSAHVIVILTGGRTLGRARGHSYMGCIGDLISIEWQLNRIRPKGKAV